MSAAMNDLEHEHRAILMALNILRGMAQRLSDGGEISSGDLADFLGFLKEFADKCHHGKEEGLLFPALLQADASLEEPVAAMLSEHVAGRQFIRSMEAALAPSLNRTDFVTAAKGYIDLLRAHIDKENQFLFPAAERVLSAEELATLSGAFDAFEAKVIGPGRHEQLHELLKTLRSKYLQ